MRGGSVMNAGALSARVDDDAGEPALRLRRGNAVAGVVLLVWLVVLFLPWWSASNGTYGFTRGFGLWDHPDVDVDGRFIWVTDVLAILPVPLLFVRVAARSIQHEPGRWRRDVAVAGASMALALASAALWPIGLPFWGRTVFPGGNGTEEQAITANPAFGWWLGLAAALVLAWAWWRARAAATEK